MLLRSMWAIWVLTFLLAGCKPNWWVEPVVDASGGGFQWTLPFPSGEYWQLTQGPGGGSHVNWGFQYGDDSFALDFSQAGCEPYGKDVTPIAPGLVIKVYKDGDGDSGYGNSVLIFHNNGYISRYGHLSELFVRAGEQVEVDDVIGQVGNTGYVVGFACSDYPGTHLHLVLYKSNVGVAFDSLSGVSDLDAGCWYSRDGFVSCSGNPGDYEASDPQGGGGGDFDLSLVTVDPKEGTEDRTHFVWVAVVDSPSEKPEATLWIHNPLHNVDYPFAMETESEESPWVFTYRKSLLDPVDYPYWVEVEGESGYVESAESTVEVQPESSLIPDYLLFFERADDGEAAEDWFNWEALFRSRVDMDMTLKIVNPEDGYVYSFPMEMDELQSDFWIGSYGKTLSDQTIYPYWVLGSNAYGVDTSEVHSVEAY